MAPNPRDVGISWRACTCASVRRAIGASMLAFVLASMLSAAAPSAAARPVQVAAVAGDDADTCKQASGDVAIAACTRAIASGRYAGHYLAKLLTRVRVRQQGRLRSRHHRLKQGHPARSCQS